MLQITERINTSFKARLRNSRRRAVGNVTGKDEDDVEDDDDDRMYLFAAETIPK